MPWPEFSELSFGFAFLREFERRYSTGGHFPAAPDFITQSAEATKGYDVEIMADSAPVFFQFKRSFVLTTRNAKEIRNGDFGDPNLFRMHLHEKEYYRQHLALQALEKSGANVFYVTSQIEKLHEINQLYITNRVCDEATAIFSPAEICIPNTTEEHYVTFQKDGDFGYVYSEEGYYFERIIQNWEILARLLQERRRAAEVNRKILSLFASSLSDMNPSAAQLASQFDDPAIRASVMAFLVLDTHLAFFGGRSTIRERPKLRSRPKPSRQ